MRDPVAETSACCARLVEELDAYTAALDALADRLARIPPRPPAHKEPPTAKRHLRLVSSDRRAA